MEQAQVTWDAFGNPIQAIDYARTEAHVRYGPISRPMVPDSARGKSRFLYGRGSVLTLRWNERADPRRDAISSQWIRTRSAKGDRP